MSRKLIELRNRINQMSVDKNRVIESVEDKYTAEALLERIEALEAEVFKKKAAKKTTSKEVKETAE